MNKKHIIRIVSAVIIVSLTVAGIVLGTKFDKTNLDKQAAAPSTTAAAEKKTEKSMEEEKNTEKTAETQDSTQVTEKTAEKSNTQNTANTTKSAKTETNDSGKDSHGHPWCPHGQCPEICETCNPPTPQRDYGEAATLLSLINSYRASLGLSQFRVEGFMQEYSM